MKAPANINQNGSNPKKKNGNQEKKKFKKESVKPALESPFSLDWPPMDFKLYSEVVSFLRAALSRLCEEASKAATQTITESMKRQRIKARKSAVSPFLTLGFNAVMRGVEKGDVVCVWVNSEAKPEFLSKSFIPVCKLKGLPLIPVKGLSGIINETVGISSCLALGMKACSKEEGRWRGIYCKSCKLVGLKINLSPTSAEEPPAELPKAREARKPLTEDQIEACLLRRPSKSERVFQPPKRATKTVKNILSLNSDFIGINDPTKAKDPQKKKKKNCVPMTGGEPVAASECSFFIDNEGDAKKPDDTKKNLSGLDENSKKRKLDAPPSAFSYVSTKIKKTKRNPNRR